MNKRSTASRFTRHKAFPLLIILVVLIIIAMVLSSGILEGRPFSSLFTRGFISTGNMINIFYRLVTQSFMICGIILILIGGQIDLSVAGQAGICAMIFAWICQNTAIPWILVLLMVAILGGILGLVNTFLVNALKFPSFIATIGMSSIYAGFCNIITKGNNIQISRAGAIGLAGTKVFGFLPVTFIIAAVVLIAYQFVLSRTTFGRSIFMCGGNPNAARLSGLNPNRMRMFLFVNSGVLAAIGGVFWSLQVKLASPTGLVTSGFDFRVISAAVLGGVSFRGGSGSVGGAFVALLLLNVFENILNLQGIGDYWIVFAQGAILVVALIIDYISEERRRKALIISATSGA